MVDVLGVLAAVLALLFVSQEDRTSRQRYRPTVGHSDIPLESNHGGNRIGV